LLDKNTRVEKPKADLLKNTKPG